MLGATKAWAFEKVCMDCYTRYRMFIVFLPSTASLERGRG